MIFLGSIIRGGFCIMVLYFYLVLHGLRYYPKSNLMDISVNQSLSKYIPSFLSNFLYFFFQFRNWITVAGIRSTGLSACLGIAKHVGQLLKNEIGHKRDNDSALLRCSPGRGLAWHTGGATVVMDGEQYMMTHPITRFGHQFSSKL